ncbi:MAG: hypothetical protein AVDCRST_MAG91-1316, partial [uncultured Sphingomonadaceae bacterium]
DPPRPPRPARLAPRRRGGIAAHPRLSRVRAAGGTRAGRRPPADGRSRLPRHRPHDAGPPTRVRGRGLSRDRLGHGPQPRRHGGDAGTPRRTHR